MRTGSGREAGRSCGRRTYRYVTSHQCTWLQLKMLIYMWCSEAIYTRQLASRQASDDEAYMSLGIVLHRLAFIRLTVVVLVTPMRGSRTDERQ
jgi:hypothetical protein